MREDRVASDEVKLCAMSTRSSTTGKLDNDQKRVNEGFPENHNCGLFRPTMSPTPSENLMVTDIARSTAPACAKCVRLR